MPEENFIQEAHGDSAASSLTPDDSEIKVWQSICERQPLLIYIFFSKKHLKKMDYLFQKITT